MRTELVRAALAATLLSGVAAIPVNAQTTPTPNPQTPPPAASQQQPTRETPSKAGVPASNPGAATAEQAKEQTQQRGGQPGVGMKDPPVNSSISEQGTPRTGSAAKSGGPIPATQSGDVQLPEQELTRVQNMFLNDRTERVAGPKFALSVGTRVPQTVRLVPLQTSIGETVPQWRGHSYVFAEDKLAIVDPNTSMIVAVLDAPPAWKAERGGVTLALTPEQRSMILANVKPDPAAQPRTALSGIQPGENVPQNIELRAMPSQVTEQVSELKGHRFFIAENDVVVVHPQEARIVAIVERQ